jgi:hypothetical protein
MSRPRSTADAPTVPTDDDAVECDLDIIEGRHAEVGSFGVVRVLPRPQRRTEGAWCFADHMGPDAVTEDMYRSKSD